MARIDKFAFTEGTVLAKKYIVLEKIGDGWEGEVYLVKEKGTGVFRAAKVFYPHRDKRGKTTRFTARKLHKLRECHVMTHYHHQETIVFKEQQVRMLLSEFVDGQLLSQFMKEQPGKRLTAFEGLHVLYALAKGLEPMHDLREYHGDIHEHNIFVMRRGVGFSVKLIDVYNYGKSSAELIAGDVVDCVKLFYEIIGGKKHYAKHPQWVKDIICGKREALIVKKFKTASALVKYLERIDRSS
jgi:serine/threonine protein kinase